MNILRPAVLPDEFALGYHGRVMRLNGWLGPKEAARQLALWAGAVGSGKSNPAVVEFLAQVAGLAPTQFVRRHSLLGFKRAFAAEKESPALAHGAPESRETLRMTGMQTARDGSFFCRQCVREDLDFHGFSYWRRTHQLPGVFWCDKHGCALCYSDATDGLLRSPAEFNARCTAVDEAWVARLQGNPLIARFLAICTELADAPAPLDERDVSSLLRKRAANAGWHVGRGTARRPHLTALLRERFDASWLATVVPDIGASDRARPLSISVDRALLGKRLRVSPAVYAAMLAALFGSADEAIYALHSSRAASPVADPGGTDWPRDIDSLRRIYVAHRGDATAIGAAMRTSRGNVGRRLKAMGLPSLGSPAQCRLRDAAWAFLVDGESLLTASQNANIPVDELEQLLRLAAAPLQSALGEMQEPRGRSNRSASVRYKPARPPGQAVSAETVPIGSAPDADAGMPSAQGSTCALWA
ncbi:MAG TPA: TniQ family protein [Thiomonas arsenitoxydans]|jgi:hypothetical protein|uniref:TniQ family protein n=1 Tax=Thiomonas TaxID=32012 RepID=UPI002580812E|nr:MULTISPECIES: TniQ family protein [Thiomonas]HML80615.1 TniQ family protein [Thiomonas arsenitoxydans]